MIMTLIADVNENNYHLPMDEFRAALAKLGARWSLLEEETRRSVDPGALRH